MKRLIALISSVALIALTGVSALASTGDDYIPDDDVIIKPTYTIEEEKEPNPLTPEGNLEMVDDAKSVDDKEFYTVKTRNEEYFYIIIDKQRSEDNVYFLNMVDESDLERIVKEEGVEETEEEAESILFVPEEEEPQFELPEVEEEETTSNKGVVFFIVIGLIALGGAAYFKFYKKDVKKDFSEDREFLDEDQYDDDFFPPEPSEVRDAKERADELEVIDLDEEVPDTDLYEEADGDVEAMKEALTKYAQVRPKVNEIDFN